MSITQSLHIGTGSHSIGTKGKLDQISKHNERLYTSKENANKDIYNFLPGTISKNVRDLYQDIFQSYVDEYNKGQKRADRQIGDYLQYVSDDSRQDVAVELILQYGDKEFWDSQENWKYKDREKLMLFFKNQLGELSEITSDLLKGQGELVIAQATLHMDEASPHMHIVAIPAMKSRRHVKLQPIKSKLFSKARLPEIHDRMRESANKFFEKEYGVEVLKDDSPDRGYVEISDYKEQKARADKFREQCKGLEYVKECLESDVATLQEKVRVLERSRTQIIQDIENLSEKYQNLSILDSKEFSFTDRLVIGLAAKRPKYKQYIDEIARSVLKDKDLESYQDLSTTMDTVIERQQESRRLAEDARRLESRRKEQAKREEVRKPQSRGRSR